MFPCLLEKLGAADGLCLRSLFVPLMGKEMEEEEVGVQRVFVCVFVCVCVSKLEVAVGVLRVARA